MALIYLTTWPMTLIGVALIAIVGGWGYAVFVPSAVTMTVWAFDLNGRDPEADDAVMPRGWKALQVTWYRVVLGFELPRAWRTWQGIKPTFRSGQQPGNPAPPKSRN